MAKKSKKVVETPEETRSVIDPYGSQEEIEETEENKDEIENNEEIQENNEELPEEIEEEIQETPKPQNDTVVTTNNNDIKEVLSKKKEISQKQKLHLQKSREIMIQKERQKKVLMKKFNELVKLDINLDDVIENAKKLKVKNDYEKLYGKKKQEEQILEKPKRVKSESESEENEIIVRQEKRQLTKQDLLRNKLRGLF